ncbi:MAG: SPFH domain-containing protein [Patescibacteria group bacterium]
MILFILFILALGIGAVFYIKYRKREIPIGNVGVLTFMKGRTRRIFGEGIVFVPPFCEVEVVSVMVRSLPLTTEDTATHDGFRVVITEPMVMFELLQAADDSNKTMTRLRLNTRIWRRFIPYQMDDQLALFLNIRGELERQIQVRALTTISTFTAMTDHDKLLGFHVVKLVKQLMSDGDLEMAKASPEEVLKTRDALMKTVTQELTTEFSPYGVTNIRFAYRDLDPSGKLKELMDEMEGKLQEMQREQIATTIEVNRALVIANAVVKFKKENPEANLEEIYQMMREQDNFQIAAEKGTVEAIGQMALRMFAKNAKAVA